MNENDELPITNGSHPRVSYTHQKARFSPGLTRLTLGVCMLVVAAMLGACSASPASTTNPSSGAPATLVPLPSATSAPVAAPTLTSLPQPTATTAVTPTKPASVVAATQQQAVNTNLDPCTLISSDEASTLTGTTFAQGVESSTAEGLKICTYSIQGSNIFTVDVIQAPDVATAQQAKTQFQADLQASVQQLTNEGITFTQLPDFADGAITGQVSINEGGISVNGSSFAFLKGTVFVGFSDIAMNGAAPSSDALQTEATTVLAKLP